MADTAGFVSFQITDPQLTFLHQAKVIATMKIYSLLLLVASGSAFSPAFVNKQALPLTPLAMAEDDFDGKLLLLAT